MYLERKAKELGSQNNFEKKEVWKTRNPQFEGLFKTVVVKAPWHWWKSNVYAE